MLRRNRLRIICFREDAGLFMVYGAILSICWCFSSMPSLMSLVRMVGVRSSWSRVMIFFWESVLCSKSSLSIFPRSCRGDPWKVLCLLKGLMPVFFAVRWSAP